MIHPLLSLRLFFKSIDNMERALPTRHERKAHPVRNFAGRAIHDLYVRWGPAAGFIAGLALAFWALLPHANA